VWQTLIRSYDPEARCGAGATSAGLAALEITFSGQVPGALVGLLCVLDGALDGHGSALCWCAERIRDENVRMRTSPLYRETFMPFDSLLFFAEEEGGRRVGLAVIPGMIVQPNVYVWDPSTDSRTWIAPSLGEYLLARVRRGSCRAHRVKAATA
jgi:SUKH superfamily protein